MSATPQWATHHPDGSWSCTDCGRASKSIDGVRGHRRACPGISGVAAQVDRIVGSVASSQPPRAAMNGSQHTAPRAAVAVQSQPRWSPVPHRVVMAGIPASQPPASDQSMEIASLKQEVFRLRDAVKQLGEVAANDIQHLAEARVIEAEKPSPWPPVIVLGLVGVFGYWLFGAADAQDEAPSRTTMGSSRSSGSAMGRIADKVVNKVVDRALGKALGMVF